MNSTEYKNKKFKFIMPVKKAYTDDKDGYYYIEYALSTTDEDLENEQMTENAIDSMVKQATNINSFEAHLYGLDDVIGPVVKAWKDEAKNLWVKVRVKPSLTPKIKELIDTGVKLGGSIGGIYIDDFMDKGVRKINDLLLLDATLTPLPVNFSTSGTARESTKTVKCKNNICKQIFKSIHEKYNKKGDKVPDPDKMAVKSLPKTDSDSYEYLMSMVSRAVSEEYSDDSHGTYVKRTFPDSVLVEIYEYLSFEDGPIYDIPYSFDENGNIVLGDLVEADTEYIEKKLQELNIKDFKPIFKEINQIRGDLMKDEELKKYEVIGKAMGETVLKGVSELLDNKKEQENVPEIKEINTDEIAEKSATLVLKALGVEVEEETPEPESGKIIIMDAKAFEENQSDLIQKTILKIGEKNKGMRKSKSIAGSKFEIPETRTPESKSEPKGKKKVSTMKAAEMLAAKKGLI